VELLLILMAVVIIFCIRDVVSLKRENKRLNLKLQKEMTSDSDSVQTGVTQNSEDQSSHDLSDEESTKQAMLVEKVKLLRTMAEVHLSDLDDEYESNTLRNRIEKAKELA